MAEGNSNKTGRDTLPQRGKVNQVCKQWLIHEDGALAYQLQNKEIDQHYGLNRFNRRTVREDIPVARVVQTDEEVRQQEERFQELEALKAQAEEDEEVARRVMAELNSEDVAHRRQREIEDEEVARTVQEKEKKKYEKYMEKKRIKELKKEREILERQLEQHTQDARLIVRSSQDTGTSEEDVGELQNSFGDMAVSGRNSRSERNGYSRYMYRVTPSGRIEDEGDFTDFFAVPDDIPPEQRSHLQQLQDEELARLLQEQEHKRTKAEVDRAKLREIEEQDERLAKIIQEQESLRAKRAKEKKKQQDEVKRQQQMSLTNPATRPLPDLPGKRISSDPPVNKSHDHHRLRRDSFIQSIENRTNEHLQRSESEQNTTSSRHSSHRQPPRQHSYDVSSRPRLPTPDEVPPHSARSVEQWVLNSAREMQNQQQERRRIPSNRSDEMIPSPSPPGSYHSEDELPYRPPLTNSRVPVNNHNNHVNEPCYAVSNPIGFNIAAAIDPTYRRSNGTHTHSEETDMKMPILSSSMPIPEEFDLEWDPSLRGSLRRPKGSWNPLAVNNYHDQLSGRDGSFSDEGPVISPFQPVQGQRRTALDKQKARKSSMGSSKKDKQGNCKQQ